MYSAPSGPTVLSMGLDRPVKMTLTLSTAVSREPSALIGVLSTPPRHHSIHRRWSSKRCGRLSAPLSGRRYTGPPMIELQVPPLPNCTHGLVGDGWYV